VGVVGSGKTSLPHQEKLKGSEISIINWRGKLLPGVIIIPSIRFGGGQSLIFSIKSTRKREGRGRQGVKFET